MKTSSKIKTFLIIFFIAIFAIITARHFIGLHFKKKFSVRPTPGVIVSTVETITPGAGITLNFFLKWRPIKCLAVMIAKIAIKKIIRKVLIFVEVFIFF